DGAFSPGPPTCRRVPAVVRRVFRGRVAAPARDDVHRRTEGLVRPRPDRSVTTQAPVAARGRDLPSFVPTFYPVVVAVTYFGLLLVGLGVSIFSGARLFV